jgi:mono/diheme cytochrome c family protein
MEHLIAPEKIDRYPALPVSSRVGFAWLVTLGAATVVGGALYCFMNLAGGGGACVAGPVGAADARVERGRYLVTILGCNDCHTPLKMTRGGPVPDVDRLLSGHPETVKLPPPPKPQGAWVMSGSATNTAFAGPWGISYAANLTPDKNTGLGIWDETMFVQALRTGRHFGQARPIQPPMPWQAYGQMTDADIRAVFAYLRTVAPIHNRVPDYQSPDDLR